MVQTQTPYIGSKISLISKSDIRYEGVLYTVDTKDATIALTKVRSFGTEDRPTATPVQPHDETFEYIIFKASDIKELTVCEHPKPPSPPPNRLFDPAIVSMSQMNKNNEKPSSAARVSRQPGDSDRNGISPTTAIDEYELMEERRQQSSAMGAPRNAANRNVGLATVVEEDRGSGTVRDNAMRGPHQHWNMPYEDRNRGQPYFRGGRGGLGNFPGYPPMHNAWNNPRAFGRGMIVPQDRPVPKFDFDFERANCRFQRTLDALKHDFDDKIKICGEDDEKAGDLMHLEDSRPSSEASSGNMEPLSSTNNKSSSGDGTTTTKEKKYDKQRSFFDSISTEVGERQAFVDAPRDRQSNTNVDTFGLNAIRYYQMRRRGRGVFRPFLGTRGTEAPYNSGYMPPFPHHMGMRPAFMMGGGGDGPSRYPSPMHYGRGMMGSYRGGYGSR